MRLVVLISGSGTNLQAIIDAIGSGSLPAELAAVVSNRPDAFGLERARQAKIPALCLDHKTFSDRSMYDQALVDLIKPYQPDLIVLAGFMRILTPTFIDAFSPTIINIHPSLLPDYRGLHTHQRVLDAKESEHGCTVHTVTAGLDDGPILGQARLNVNPEESASQLAERVHALEHQLYPAIITAIAQNRISLKEPPGEYFLRFAASADLRLLPVSGPS